MYNPPGLSATSNTGRASFRLYWLPLAPLNSGSELRSPRWRNDTWLESMPPSINWLQAMEGGIDSSHVSFLHRGDLNSDPLFKGAKGNQYNLNDARPVFEVAESPGGLYIGARRNAEGGAYY